jgi:hypothetical protein
MDNYSTHAAHDVIRLLTEARVCIITVGPHAIHVLQVIHLTLFGFLDWRPRV